MIATLTNPLYYCVYKQPKHVIWSVFPCYHRVLGFKWETTPARGEPESTVSHKSVISSTRFNLRTTC